MESDRYPGPDRPLMERLGDLEDLYTYFFEGLARLMPSSSSQSMIAIISTAMAFFTCPQSHCRQ